jgi:2-amino-4-hydroxy-6-hydroxymethyldihydropteridine diphosphokinase
MNTAYIALGANLGDRTSTIESALRALGEFGRVTNVSSLYETDPVGFEDQPRYLNAVAELETALPPVALLDELLRVEAEHGRVRTFANAPRSLDLDLLLYDREVLETEKLTLPHPRMHERAFVLVPLAEIAPNAYIPSCGSSAAQLLAQLGTISGVDRYPTPLLVDSKQRNEIE